MTGTAPSPDDPVPGPDDPVPGPGNGRADAPAADGLRVLNLVTNREARFFRQQVRVLAGLGVESRTLAVPGGRDADGTGGRSPADYLRLVPRVRRAVRDGFDLVHANYGLTGPAALAQRRLPVVLSLWGSDLLGTFGPASRLCARLADEVVVMSRRMARALGADCRVVPHGVDLDLFCPSDRSAARAAVGWPGDRRHVLFPYPPAQAVKNYPLAERVVAAADARLSDPVDLRTVAGEPHDRMPTYLNAADALLLPSDREGSPNAVKEALACNVPVVATDVGDVRERLAGVEPSRVCTAEADLVDGLVAVLRADRRSNGRAAVRGLSVERTGERLLAAYESALDGR